MILLFSVKRPLSVLPVVYRLWASLRLGHLREWVEGWLPKSVFSLGKGLSSVEALFSVALDIEEVLSGTGGDQLHVMVVYVIKSFDTVDRSILDCALGRLGLPDWFRKVNFLFIVRFVSGSSLLLDMVSHGVGMVVFHRAVRSVWFLLWLFMSLGVVIWMLCLMLSLSCMLISLSAVLSVLVPCLNLLGSLLGMSGQSVRTFLLVGVSFSALLSLFGEL